MMYHPSTLMTLIIVVAALLAGGATAALFRGVARNLWAGLVSLGFVLTGGASVLLEMSWVASEMQRLVVQSVALFLLLTGFTFASRARG
jgi:hypothetical protein